MGDMENDLIIELIGNPELKREFISDPKRVLKDKGFKVEDDIEYRVVEDTKNIRYIIIPYLERKIQPKNEPLEKRRSKTIIGPGKIGCDFGFGP